MSFYADLVLDTALIDHRRLNQYRLEQVQSELCAKDIAALITYDPVNTRYATGMRNMQVWAFHSIIRMGIIPAEGKAIIFEYGGSEHLADELDTISQIRPAIPLHFGPGLSNHQSQWRLNNWVREVEDVIHGFCKNEKRVALDNQVPYVAGAALRAAGFEIGNGYSVLALAQSIKNEDEIRAMQRSVDVAEIGIKRLEENIQPGVSENELWAILNHTNIQFGGEYMDTRLLSSGQRTNPWYQECGERKISSGDMIALDTDMIGPYGYDADISRSFVCDVEKATPRQKEIYRVAYDHIHHNMDLIRPGVSFRELAERGFVVPEKYRQQAIAMNWHGVSLYGGWPNIVGNGYFDEQSEDGEIKAGMTLCVESYIGERGGPDGVKLEEQILVTENGYRKLSHYPYQKELLGS